MRVASAGSAECGDQETHRSPEKLGSLTSSLRAVFECRTLEDEPGLFEKGFSSETTHNKKEEEDAPKKPRKESVSGGSSGGGGGGGSYKPSHWDKVHVRH